MKVYILNASNTLNYGSMMMAENFIATFDNNGSDNTFFVETDDLESTEERLRTATGKVNIHTVPEGSLYEKGFITKKELLLSVLFKLKIFSELAADVDMIAVLGGDDYTEDYGWRSLISQLLRTNAISRVARVLFIGQTMGPFYSFRIPAARYFLGKVEKIYVRDSITFQYLKKMKLRNIAQIPDLALLSLTEEKITENTQKYICVFPSELIHHFAKNQRREDCVLFYANVCLYIKKEFPGYQLVLIPHVLKPASSDDRIMLRAIRDALGNEEKKEMIFLDTELYPYEVREYIRNSYLVVSARMHPIISAIECLVPWVCFSYSRKYWGILGEGYKLSEYILDVRDLNYKELYENFQIVLRKVTENQAEIKAKIKTQLDVDQRKIKESIHKLAISSF